MAFRRLTGNLFLICLFLACSNAHIGRTDLSDEKHFSESGVHNPKFDHEAFLGKELASQLMGESFDDNKKRLVEIFAKIDADHNGTVGEPEMYNWIKRVQKNSVEKDAMTRWSIANPNKLDLLPWKDYLENSYDSEDKMDKESARWRDYMRFKTHDERRWKAADSDKDGKLSFEEYKAFIHPEDYKPMRDVIIDETLESIDNDGDGFISVEEYLADFAKNSGNQYNPNEPRPDWASKEAEGFDRWRDKNHDGKLDREEIGEWIVPKDYDPIEAETKHLFYHADSNRDGQMSVKEMLDNQGIFVGSAATEYGKHLHSHTADEL